MRIDTEKWPDHLKEACRESCAANGEPACWEVDEWINPQDPDRGKVCGECAALLNLQPSTEGRPYEP